MSILTWMHRCNLDEGCRVFLRHCNFFDVLGFFVVIAGGLGCCILMIDDELILTRTNALHIAILYLSSMTVGYCLEYFVGIPNLLGSLLTGIILRNCGVFEDFNLPDKFTSAVRAMSLSWILLVSGIEIEISKVGSLSLRLMLFPGVVEAVSTAGMAMLLFNMPFALSLSQGFILAAVSPAIIIPYMIELRKKGVGGSCIPSLLMSAASLDDIIAISGFSVCIGIALDSSDTNLALSLFVHGPVSLFLGALIGSVGGLILAAITQVSASWQSTLIALEIALLMTHFCEMINFDASEALAALSMGAVANIICKHPKVSKCSCTDTVQMHKVGKEISAIWNIAMRPLLFGTIGTAFDLDLTRKDELFKGTAVVLLGLAMRVATAYFATSGSALSFKERLFVAFAWIPKATVQAALCSIPLTMILKSNKPEMISWGNQIVFTSVLSVLISAPIGVLAIQGLATRLLTRGEHEKAISPRSIGSSRSP